jgi:hypothetical protein
MESLYCGAATRSELYWKAIFKDHLLIRRLKPIFDFSAPARNQSQVDAVQLKDVARSEVAFGSPVFSLACVQSCLRSVLLLNHLNPLNLCPAEYCV